MFTQIEIQDEKYEGHVIAEGDTLVVPNVGDMISSKDGLYEVRGRSFFYGDELDGSRNLSIQLDVKRINPDAKPGVVVL